MKKIAIIGAGNMGSGIAQKTAQEGLSVIMMDTCEEYVEKGMKYIHSTLLEAVERKILKTAQVDEIIGRIKGTVDLSDVSDCDLVIEAIFEDMDGKNRLFAELDKICDQKTIFATNTSSFSVEELAQGTNRPDRFIGMHFFYHPAKNRLLEIVPCDSTSEGTIALARKYARLTGKTDITVKDSPCFAVNRIFVPLNNEAVRIFDDGIANIPTIDQAAKELLGVGMGPFQIMNVTGVPIAYHTQMTLFTQLGGFYTLSNSLVAKYEANETWPFEGEIDKNRIEAVKDRLSGIIFFMAVSLLDEGVADIADTDVGIKVGLRWRKGPFELMNDMGIGRAYNLVEKLLEPWPGVTVPKSLLSGKDKMEPWDIRYVKYVQDGEIGRVRISRPDAMNALNKTVVKQLDDAFKEAEADPNTKSIVIEAAGKAFVAGADIKFFVDCIKEDRLSDNYEFTSFGHEVLNRIDDSKKPVIIKMEGLALGGGLELALSGDLIVATPKAVMGFPETGIGIYPGLGGTQRTSRLIGKELAKYLIFTGRIINGSIAKAIGLVDYVFEPDEIDSNIQQMINDGLDTKKKGHNLPDLPEEWKNIKDLFSDDNIDGWLKGEYLISDDPLSSKIAGIIANKAPIALKMANNIIDKGFGMKLKDGLKEELSHLNEIFSTKDAFTGLSNTGKEKIKFEGE